MTSSLLSSLHCCCQPATDNNGGLSRFYPGSGIGGPITIVSQKLTPQILPCVCTRGGRGGPPAPPGHPGPPGPPIVSRKLGLPLWSRSTVTFRLAVCKIFMLLTRFFGAVGGQIRLRQRTISRIPCVSVLGEWRRPTFYLLLDRIRADS